MSKASDKAYYLKNKEKILARLKDQYASDPDSFKKKLDKYRASDKYKNTSKAYWLRKQYSLTPGEKESLFAAQGNKCACCGESNPNSLKPWHIDHDHDTGEIRGILCFRCNQLLGMLGDTLEKLTDKTTQLRSYLERTSSKIA